MPRITYDPYGVTGDRVGLEKGYWKVFGEQKQGIISTYRITDANLDEKWRFQVRRTERGQTSVHVLEKPAKKRYAEVSEIKPSIVFERIPSQQRSSYHPIGLWTPDGTKRIARGARHQLPRWFRHRYFSRSVRIYSNVRGGGNTLADKQVFVTARDDDHFMIRVYFAEKIWPMVEFDRT